MKLLKIHNHQRIGLTIESVAWAVETLASCGKGKRRLPGVASKVYVLGRYEEWCS